MFKQKCTETITALRCGIIGSHEYEEIVVVTYTGRIFGLTTQTIDGDFQSIGDSNISVNHSQLLAKLK